MSYDELNIRIFSLFKIIFNERHTVFKSYSKTDKIIQWQRLMRYKYENFM